MKIRFDDGLDLAKVRTAVEHTDALTELRPPIETPEGYLKCEGRIARVGVLTYRLDDGSTLRELVTPEELFSHSSISSHSQLPLTLEHPTENGKRVGLTSENAKKFSVGSVANARRDSEDGDWLVGDFLITDEAAKAAVRSGVKKISDGYYADVYFSPGVVITDDGSEVEFDAIQMNRRGNHVALTRIARAGEHAQLRADSIEKREKKMATKKITLFGQPVELEESIADRVLEAQRSDTSDARAQLEVEKAKREVLEAEQKKAKEAEAAKLRTDSEEKAVREKTAVILKAKSILDKKEEDLLKMDSAEIMRECIAKRHPSLDTKEKSKEALSGMFEMLKTDAASELNSEEKRGGLHTDDKDDPVEKAYQASVLRMQNAWKGQTEAKAK